MSALTTVFAQGLAASRPAAASTNNGWFYLATDTNGGTLYQSNGSSWVQCAAGVTQAAASFRGCRVANSTTQAIANNTTTTITWDTNTYDTDSLHSTVTNTSRITATHAGHYSFKTNILFAPNSTGVRLIQFKLNGTTGLDQFEVPATTGFTSIALPMDYNMNASDYMEVTVLQTSGGSLNATPQSFCAINNG